MINDTDIKVMQRVSESVCRTEARRWPGGRNLIEDCVQAVLLEVLKGIKRLSLSGPDLARYTRTTAFFAARHFFRKHCLGWVSLDAPAELPDPGAKRRDETVRRQTALVRIEAALLQLPPAQREALLGVARACNHNHAAEALAKRWGCKRHKVYYLRSLAIKAIREHLGLAKEGGHHAY
jgi:DNA-directed RNA polymerase specialized sigma24 family protein